MNRKTSPRRSSPPRCQKGIKWADVAKKVGLSKEWVTAGCLGQMTFDEGAGRDAGQDLRPDRSRGAKWLQVVPYKGSLPTAVPTDPLIYRFYEMVSVYGTTFKELIHEEFGDGIMSAIDFTMDLSARPTRRATACNIVMSGKFLPYKTYLRSASRLTCHTSAKHRTSHPPSHLQSHAVVAACQGRPCAGAALAAPARRVARSRPSAGR